MRYEYKCPTCDSRLITGARGDRLDAECTHCGDPGPHVRVFSISVHRPLAEHWNETVQAPVRGMDGFKRALKKRGDEYGERTGIQVNYQPLDMSDRKAVGVTDDVDRMIEEKRTTPASVAS